MTLRRTLFATLLIAAAVSARSIAAEPRPVRVGAAATLDLKLPAGVRAADVTDESNLVVTVAPQGNAPGSEVETAVTVIPTRPGTFDVRESLLTPDGKPLSLGTPLLVRAFSTLPPDAPLEAADVPLAPLPRVGGYKLMATIVVVFWMALLVPLIFWKRQPRVRPVEAVVEVPPTTDEQLLALIRDFRAGTPTVSDKVRLEALLQNAWRRRFGWAGLTMEQSLRELRRSPESAALIDELDRCFHAPTNDDEAADGLARVFDGHQRLAALEGRA